jgi:DNA polymerase III alpha subunit (gram-positive type)
MASYAETPLVFFDIETTGLRAGHHEITELGFIHEKLGGWCVRVKPKYPERFDDAARAISGYNDQEWAGAPPLEEVMLKIREFTYESIIVGHNIIGYDIPFFNANCKMVGIDYEIPMKMNMLIDTQMLALTHLVPRGLRFLGLRPCCTFFGISNDGQHNAYDDCARTKLVFEGIMGKLRWDDGKAEQRELWQ